MQTFATAREAKDFLISRIVSEARHEGIPLSEVERKMLYFSETAWTLPDIAEVNEAFDREYDQGEYEQRIAKLIGKIRANACAGNKDEFDTWTEAARTLRKEDHYLLVMIDAAGASGRQRGDRLKLWATALVVASLILAIALLATRR